jgi:hypothetical protein
MKENILIQMWILNEYTKDRPICSNNLLYFLLYFHLNPDGGHVGSKQVEKILLYNKYICVTEVLLINLWKK